MNRSSLFKPKPVVLIALLLPGLLVFSLCSIMPLFVSAWFSLFKWSGGPVMTFVGLQNYVKMLHDLDFWLAFKNNVTFVVWTVIGQIGLAFLITMLLISRILKFKEFYRTVIFFPVVLSAVVVGFLWNIMYSKDYGLLNYFLRTVHLSFLIKPWLDSPKYVIMSLAIPKIWQYIGYYMVILLAAVHGIPQDILEVSELDGATGLKKAFYIVLPLIWDTVKVCVMLCIAGNMKTFDQIFVMTGGGPGNSSMVLALYAYKASIEEMKLGYGSTLSIGILILSLALILISQLVTRGKKDA